MEGLGYMAIRTVNEKIFKQIGDEIIELQGVELEEFIAKEEQFELAKEQLEAEAEAKATAKAALLEQLGITEEQAKLLLS